MSTGPPIFSLRSRSSARICAQERRAADQAVEGDDEAAGVRCPVDQDGAVDPAFVRDARRSGAAPGIFGPHSARTSFTRDRLEAPRLHVDDVELSRRVADHLVRRDVDPQPGLARRDQHRVVVAQAVDGARPEAGHETHETVLALDPRRPAELVVGERDAGERRQEVLADARLPTTSWIMMPISSWRSRRPRSARYSIGSGPKIEA